MAAEASDVTTRPGRSTNGCGRGAGRGGPLLPDDGADAGRRPHEHLRLPARSGRTDLPGHPAPHALRHHVPGGPGDHRPDPRVAARPGDAAARPDPAGLEGDHPARLRRGVPGLPGPLRLGGRGSRLRRRRPRRPRHARVDRRPALVEPAGRAVRRLRRGHDRARRGVHPPPQRQGVLHPGRRVEHLRRRRLRGQLHRDGATVAVGVQQHPGPVGNASGGRDGADRAQRRAARRHRPFGPRPLQGPRQRPPRPAALPRLRGVAAPPAERLPGLLGVAALPRRDPPPPRARRRSGPATTSGRRSTCPASTSRPGTTSS